MPVQDTDPVGGRGWGVGVVEKGGLANCHGYQSCPGRDQGGRGGGIGEKARKKPKKGCVSLLILLTGLLMTN